MGVNPDLVKVVRRAIQIMDFSVISGARDMEEQDALYAKGRTTGIQGATVTNVQWPDSMHNRVPAAAVDIAPYPINWTNHPKAIARFYLLAGVVLAAANELEIDIEWGGDWDGDWDIFDQRFDDLGHFQIRSLR